MVTEDKRSATEVLLSIESELKTLSKRVQNSENLLKILLSKSNKTPQPVGNTVQQVQTVSPVIPNVVNKDNFENRAKTNKFAEMAAQQGVQVEEEQEHRLDQTFVASPSKLPPDPSGEDMVEAPSRGNARGQRGPKNKGGKSSVSQVLEREDGQPLFLANIEVLDENGVLINQTRTNTKGRWLMALAPGDYQVRVLKRFPPDSGKESINTTYQINVPPSDKPMELAPLSLDGGLS